MNRIDELSHIIEKRITSGEYGISGSRFITARDFVEQFKCSSRDAMRVYGRLKSEGVLRSLGGSYYVCTGFCKAGTPLRKMLDRKQKPILGVLVNNINNPFFSSIAKSLQTVTSADQMQLLISDGGGIWQREREIMDMFLDLGCCGVFNCTSLSFRQQQYFSCYPLPIVTIAEDVNLTNADVVLVDNFNAGKQVANHLMACQCRSFYYLGLDDCVDSDQRFEGYYRQLIENGKDLPAEHIGIIPNAGGTINIAGVKSFISSLLHRMNQEQENLPVGIFCHHDMLAVEALRAVKYHVFGKQERLTVPKDIMIVGFDDLPITQAVSPTITTMAYLYTDIAKMAFNVMTDYHKNANHHPRQYEVRSSLVVRESSGGNTHDSSSSDIGNAVMPS